MNNLKAYGYAGLGERSKVRHLLRGANHLMMEASKTLITYKPAKRNIFDQPSVLLMDTYHHHHTKRPSGIKKVSETNTGRGPRPMRGGGGGFGGVGRSGQGVKSGFLSKGDVNACNHITLCWYSGDEYHKMNAAEEQKLWNIKKEFKKSDTLSVHYVCGSDKRLNMQ